MMGKTREEIMSSFGERVSQARRANTELSEAELARKVDINPNRFNKWVNAEKEPPVPVTTYFAIADVLGVSIYDIFPKSISEATATLDALPPKTTPSESNISNAHVLVMLDHAESAVMAVLNELLQIRRAIRDHL